MKKVLSVLIALMLVFSVTAVWASTVPEIDNKDNCVVDMADVISQDTEDMLSMMNKALEEKTGASIVVATTDFTGSLSMEEYAYEAFNKWGVGDEDKDNGLLLVMSLGDEDYWAVQGKGIEKDLTSAEIDQMLYDYLESYFAKEDYDSGAKAFYLAAYDWYQDFYDVDLVSVEVVPENESNDPAGVTDNEKGGNGLGKLIFWVVIIFIILVLISASKDDGSKPKKVYKQRTHSRRGPHTTTYRRTTPPPPPSRGIFRSGRSSGTSRTTGRSTRNTTTRSSSSTRSTASRSTSTRSSSSSRSSSGGRSGGFGGGSTRGGGAGRRK